MLDSTIITAFSDNVIFKELFEAIKSNGTFELSFAFLYGVLKSIFYVLFILMIKYYVSDPTRIKTTVLDIYDYISNICCFTKQFNYADGIFITKYLFKARNYKNKEEINEFARSGAKHIKIPSLFCLEIHVSPGTVVKYNIFYYRLINRLVKELPSFRKTLKEKWAKKDKIKQATRCFFACYAGKFTFEEFYPENMCETKWYVNLKDSIQTHLEICENRDYFKSLAILLNGRPGLGKTKFIDYVARNHTDYPGREQLCNSVTKIDMTQFINYSFTDIIKAYKNAAEIFKGNNKANILLIDEIDKYVDMNIKETYSKMLSSKKKDAEIIDIATYTKHYKETFLFDILKLIDSENHYRKNIFIFCANNFHTLFSGIDNTHFESLKNRFLSFDFEPCDREEIIKYIRYMSRYTKKLTLVEEDINMIPDVKIPFRDLTQLFFRVQYKVKDLIFELEKFNMKEYVVENSLKYRIFPKTSFYKRVMQILEEQPNKASKLCKPYIFKNKLVTAEDLMEILDTNKDVSSYMIENPNINDQIFDLFCQNQERLKAIKNSHLFIHLDKISADVLNKYGIKIPLHHPERDFDKDPYIPGDDLFVRETISSGRLSFEECEKMFYVCSEVLTYHPDAPKKREGYIYYNENLDYSHEELMDLDLDSSQRFQHKNLDVEKTLLLNNEKKFMTDRDFWYLLRNENFKIEYVKKYDLKECVLLIIKDFSPIPLEILEEFCPEEIISCDTPTIEMLEKTESRSIPNSLLAYLEW